MLFCRVPTYGIIFDKQFQVCDRGELLGLEDSRLGLGVRHEIFCRYEILSRLIFLT